MEFKLQKKKKKKKEGIQQPECVRRVQRTASWEKQTSELVQREEEEADDKSQSNQNQKREMLETPILMQRGSPPLRSREAYQDARTLGIPHAHCTHTDWQSIHGSGSQPPGARHPPELQPC